jgi:pSer/pThr/pTyr-binding forkhead associated (FHA) protein
MLGQLVPCGGGPPIPLLRPKLLVGRQESCDVLIRVQLVSSRHCELEFRDGYWFVRDLGSRNGTRVNSTPCTEQWLLPNDVLAIAACRYNVMYTAPPGRPPPARIEAPAGSSSSGSSVIRAQLTRPKTPESLSGRTSLGELAPCGGGNPISLRRRRLVVGRHEECDIVLRYPAVSGRHCELEWIDGGWSVRDLGSRNGIRVNDVICQEARLQSGSILWIGGVRFEFACPGDETADPKQGRVFAQSLLQAAGLDRWQPPDVPADQDRPRDRYGRPRERYNLDDV